MFFPLYGYMLLYLPAERSTHLPFHYHQQQNKIARKQNNMNKETEL